MRNETWQPEDVLRRALKRAGIVTGYTHVCRRKTCRYSEEREDAEIRPCQRCGFKLWPKGKVREIRFHDLRHIYASVSSCSARGSSPCRSCSGTRIRRSPSGDTGTCCRT